MLKFYSGGFCIFRRAKYDSGEINGSTTPSPSPPKSRRRKSRLGIMVKETSNRVGAKCAQQIKVQPCSETSSLRKSKNLQKFDDLYKNTPISVRNKNQSLESRLSRRRSGRGRRFSLMVAAINSDRNIFGSNFSTERNSGPPQEQSFPRYEGPSRRWTLTTPYPVSTSVTPDMLTPIQILNGNESNSTAQNLDMTTMEAIASKAEQMKPNKIKAEKTNDRNTRRNIPKRRASGRSTRLGLLTADFTSQTGNYELTKPKNTPRRRSLFWNFWPFSPAHSGSTLPRKATVAAGEVVVVGTEGEGGVIQRSTLRGTEIPRRRSLGSIEVNKIHNNNVAASNEAFLARLASVNTNNNTNNTNAKLTPAMNSIVSTNSTESPLIQQQQQQQE